MLIDTNVPIFLSDTKHLTPAQIGMLAVASNGVTQLNAKSAVERYALGNQQTITRNKKRLQELDIIEVEDERLIFVDAVYELWFRQQYYRRVQ